MADSSVMRPFVVLPRPASYGEGIGYAQQEQDGDKQQSL